MKFFLLTKVNICSKINDLLKNSIKMQIKCA